MFSVPVNLAVIYVCARSKIYRQSVNLPAILNSNSNDAPLEVPVSHVQNDIAVIPVVSSVNGATPMPAEESGRRDLPVAFPEHGVREDGAVKFFVRLKVSIHRSPRREH